ncbi:cadherin-related tumor suppressor-like [Octopus bimaculoides]|nr:cadherin-related tumor suppressor-like [Octopus bimaculoides]
MLLLLSIVLSMVHCVLTIDLTYHVEEERSPGTYVADIAADSKLLDNVKPSDQHLITFSQFKRKVAQLFNITKTGKLYTAQTLDAEDLCTFNKECSRTVKVVVNKGTSVSKILKIKIVIEDINDHEPKFPKNTVYIEFGEDDRKGSKRSLPNAIDKDVGFQNSLIQYKLKSKNGEPFSLSVSKRADGISSLKIVLKESLDREIKDTYLLQVIAKDGGSPAKQGVLNINISITDLNDNPPEFSKPLYNVSIQSTHHKSKPIIVLSVTDADSGENGKITFHFSPKTSGLAKSYFQLNETSGEILLSKYTSLGKKKAYELFVEARDGGSPPLISIATVLVNVINQHNNPPSIDIDYVSAINDNTATISEDIKVGSFIAYVMVTDNDVGQNGEVSCDIKHDTFKLQSMGSKEYKIILNKPVDRETQGHYNIPVSCQDKGLPPLKSVKTLKYCQPVVVTSSDDAVEDNAAMVCNYTSDTMSSKRSGRQGDLKHYEEIPGVSDLTYHVEEERSPGTYVADIAADSKLLDNVKPSDQHLITFSQFKRKVAQLFNITKTDNVKPSDQHLITFSQFKRKVAQLFNITKTGKLYTAQTLDAEDLCTFNKECSRTVKVIIKKVATFTKILKVKIVIEDINDHEPEFPEKQIILQFGEGDREDTMSSKRSGRQGDLKHYEEIPGVSDQNIYKNNDSSTSKDSNEETPVKHVPTINMLLSLCIVLSMVHCVLTIDLTYHVEEERSPGTYVADIAADSKLLDNVKPSDQHLITFSQFKRKVAQLFNITKTGKLYTAQTLDAEDLCTFNKECSRIVKVVVNKGTSVTKVLKIKIVIEDINDHEPEFPIKGVNIEFGEHDRKGSDRSIPNAMDKDVGFQNSLIQYKLKSKNGEPFSLSVSKRADGISSLKIVLKESLDREVKDTYLLQVIAKDGGSPAKQGVLNINISITDLNDNPPVFSKPLYNISIQSTHHKSKPIIVLSVSDADSGENGKITFKYCQPVVVTSSDDAVEDNAAMVCNYTSDTMSSKRSGRQGDLKHYEEIPGVSDQNIYKNNDTSTSKDSSEETPVKHVVTTNSSNKMLLSLCIVLSMVHCVLTIDLTYHVEEERSPGTYVADIGADSKLLDNVKQSDQHLITFSQFKRKVAQLFNITKTGKLYTAQTLDAEDLCTFNKECSRTVKIIIKKLTTFTKILKVKIVIEDINDHEPEFPEKQITLHFGEGDGRGMKKSIPNAIDKDISYQNSFIEYKLKKSDDSFSLSVSKRADGISSLNIVLKEKLDREIKDKYNLEVIAKDGGSPSKQSVLNVVIVVDDQNDNPPVFSKPLYNISIRTTHDKTKPILTLSVTDKDIGSNSKITFHFSPKTSDLAKKYFELDEKTGKVFLSRISSLNEKTSFELFIEARDGGSPPISSIATVLINVINQHNNPPAIDIDYVSAINDNTKYCQPVVVTSSDDAVEDNATMVCNYTSDTMSSKRSGRQGDLKHYEEIPGVSDQNIYKNNDASTSKDCSEETPVKHVFSLHHM